MKHAHSKYTLNVEFTTSSFPLSSTLILFTNVSWTIHWLVKIPLAELQTSVYDHHDN